MLSLLVLLAACGGEPPAPTPVAAPPAPVAPAPVAVGPDGPTSIVVPILDAIPTDPAAIAAGEKVFTEKGCPACHKFGEKLVGPDLTGLYTRRTVTWVSRMVMDPDKMTKEDPQAKDLLRALMVQMPKQGVAEADLANLHAYIQSKGG